MDIVSKAEEMLFKSLVNTKDDVIEIWEAIAFFSLDLPRPDNEYSTLKEDINNLYSNLDQLKNKL